MSVNLLDKQQLTWQEERWCFSKGYNFLYIPIPKVACSSLKTIVACCHCLEKQESILKLSTKTIHGYVRKNCSLRSLKIKQVKQLLNDKTYFKFTFVRNPWTRIASAYLDKFVVMKRLGKPVLSALYGF